MKPLILLTFLLLILSNCTSPQYSAQKVQIPNKDFDALLKSKGIILPEIGTPVANYVHTVRTGNHVYTSGKGPKNKEGVTIIGKLGSDMTIEEGAKAAWWAGLQQLAALKEELGDLNKVKRIIKVLGMVNCTPDFKDQSKVINGFSDLMVDVFGEAGQHARSAVGMAALPNGMAVEIEMIVEIYEED